MRRSVCAWTVCAAGLLSATAQAAPPEQDKPRDAATHAPGKAAPARCPRGQPLRVEGKIASDDIDELSGLVASRKQSGVLWVHNDSGDKGHVYAVDVHGRLLLQVKLEHLKPEDVEDIAIGPGKSGSADRLYLADIGDNERSRKHVLIYRLDEPSVPVGSSKAKQKQPVQTLEVRYEDGPRDAETLLADPRGGDLYLVEKAPLSGTDRPVGVYRVAAADLDAGNAVARRVASLPLGPATAGDVLPDGTGIAVRSYTRLWYWPRKTSESIDEAMQKPGCMLPLADLGQQGEAFGFIPDGSGYLTSTEGKHPRIHRYALARTPAPQ